jgi:predicted RNA-binding protein
MSPEEKAAYVESLRPRGLEIKEFLDGLFTPEEKIVRAQIEQVKELQTELMGETYEHHARMHQVLQEILRGARREEDQTKPYFPSLDALYDLDDTDHNAWLLLVAKWGEFKHGRWPSFTRPSSSTPTPGAG